MPNTDEQDKIDRYINGFATQSFRDQADRDYIAARLSCRAELMPQFLWAAQQAVEKYLKAILLYNRIRVPKLTHDIRYLLSLTTQIPTVAFRIALSNRSLEFVDHLAEYGQNRYIETPYYVSGHILVDLDLAIWELRRYCQVLNVFGKVLPAQEQELLASALADLAKSDAESRYKFHIHGGFIEKVLVDQKHPARSALLWNNATFASRKRTTVSVKNHLVASNPLLYLYPQMLDELLDYVPLPSGLVKSYQAHLKATAADPGKRLGD